MYQCACVCVADMYPTSCILFLTTTVMSVRQHLFAASFVPRDAVYWFFGLLSLCFVSRFAEFRCVASEMLTSNSILLCMLGAQYVVLLPNAMRLTVNGVPLHVSAFCPRSVYPCACVSLRFNAPASEGPVTAVCRLSTSAHWLPGYRLLLHTHVYVVFVQQFAIQLNCNDKA